MGSLLYHARASESDHAPWFGEVDIANSGEGGGDPSSSRVGEDGKVGEARTVVPGDGTAGLGHLHQGKHPFLHAGTGG